MEITDEDLRALPPPERLIKMVKDVIGIGDMFCQREAQEDLATRFYLPLRRLIGHRYTAYDHIGRSYEMEDDLQRLYAYIILGCREDSKGELKQNKHPLLTWLNNLGKGKSRNLNQYVISIANSYLRHDLPRNIKRGKGNENLVTWNDEYEEDETESHTRRERQMQLRSHELLEREKLHDETDQDICSQVRRCLELMPSDEADLLHEKYFENSCDNFTQSEYARKMGISEATVSRRLSKAKENLANRLRSVCPDLLKKGVV